MSEQLIWKISDKKQVSKQNQDRHDLIMICESYLSIYSYIQNFTLPKGLANWTFDKIRNRTPGPGTGWLCARVGNRSEPGELDEGNRQQKEA